MDSTETLIEEAVRRRAAIAVYDVHGDLVGMYDYRMGVDVLRAVLAERPAGYKLILTDSTPGEGLEAAIRTGRFGGPPVPAN